MILTGLTKLKVIKCFLLLLFSLAFLQLPAYSIIVPGDGDFKVLKAVRGKHTKRYLPGTHLRIIYSGPQNDKLIISGMLRGVSDDSIAISYGKKNALLKKVALADVQSVQKLHKKGRWGWKVMMAILVVLTIIGLLMINSSGSIFFLAVPVVALFSLIPFLIGNFLADIISKKSKKKGWDFIADK